MIDLPSLLRPRRPGKVGTVVLGIELLALAFGAALPYVPSFRSSGAGEVEDHTDAVVWESPAVGPLREDERHLVDLALRFDLNEASEADLQRIPGVGPKTAEAIVAYREEYGRFERFEELRDVPGLSENTYRAMLPYIRIGDKLGEAPEFEVRYEKGQVVVNINKASVEELVLIPGVGPAAAERIAQARPFQTLEDVMEVKGIGPSTFNKMKPYMTLEGDAVQPLGGVGEAVEGGKLNINTATEAELDALPGVGPATARRIVEYRNQHGPFQKIDDLNEVKGIGEGTIRKLAPLITVGP